MSSGNDTITGTSGVDIIDAGEGDDIVNALAGNDTITGGKGDDILNGGAGNDTYNYIRGDGNDTITELSLGGSSDRLVFTDINQADVTLVRNGTDVTLVIAESAPGAGDGGSILLKDNFEDVTDRGIDRIVFADNSAWTRASMRAAWLAQVSTSGNDTITGFNAADTITGGAGNDVMDGGKGNDIYNYARGHGNDTIIEAASGGTDDRLVLQGINPSAVSLVRNGNDVTLVIAESTPGAGDGGSVLLKDNFEEYYDQGIDKIVFGDGTIWTRAALRTAFLAQSSTSGNDVITGFAVNDTINAGDGNDQVFAGDGADTLTGGKGADSLYGGAGNDTYIYARGDGNDTIQEDSGGGAGDQLVLTGINPSAVTLVRNGADASLVIAESAPGAGDGGSILLKANFDENNGQGVDKIVFADGTIWTRAELRAMYLAQVSTAGNDTITGFGGADIINAGAGNDVVDAGGGNDDLRGGTGNDTLSGGDGSDTYHYARSDGDDIIIEGPSGGGQDSLVLEGISRSDVTVVRNGNDVTLFIAESAPGAGDGGSIQLKNNADPYPNSGVDGIVFAGGTAWSKSDLFTNIDFVGGTAGNDTVTGTSGNDLVRAGRGNDTLLGGGGNDEYHYQRGDGNDTIVEDINGGTDDRLVLEGINPADISLVRNGNDLTLVIAESAPGAGDGGSVPVKETLEDNSNRGIEKIVFADGTVWTRADLRVIVLDRAGTSGSDTIAGFSIADTIQGRAGNDALSGAGGDDTYLYARGDGNDTITEDTNNGSNDRLVFSNINAAAVSLSRSGNDVTVVIAESTPGAGDGGSVLLKNSLDEYYGQGVDKVVFADGTIWTRADIRVKLLDLAATAGNDTIAGFNTADTIQGRAGNDALNGAGGDDTYLYARGDGNDTITEDTNNGGNDRLVFTDINPSAVTLVRNGNDVTVVIAESTPGAGDGGSVLLKNSLDDYYGQGVDKVVFADGTIWTRADIRAMLVSASGTSGDDTINGTGSSDIIAGHAGNDTLNGGGGDDTYLYARGDGNDTINEGTNGGGNDQLVFSDINPAAVSLVRNGNDVTVVIAESTPGAGDGGSVLLKDTLNDSYGQGVDKVVFADGTIWTRAQLRDMLLTGTAANETFAGFWGDDTFRYARGGGNDTIVEDTNSGSGDRLLLTDINPSAVSLARNGNDVTVVIAESTPGAGDGGSVLLKNSLDDYYGQGVDKVVFADGTIWTRADIRVKLLDQAATAGNDTIVGFNIADTIQGRAGNDALNGARGDDTYLYARGDGNDTVTEDTNNGGNDRLVFININPAVVSLVRSGNDVTVVIAESTPGAGDGGSVLLKNSLDDYYGQGVDKVVFADGTTWTRADIRVKLLDQAGTVGNDTITGFNSADTIQGRAGNDTLNGAGGDDTYLYARGDGNDTIFEGTNNGGNDRLVFSDINPASVSLVRNGNDVSVVIAESTPGAGDGGSVLLKDTLNDYYGQGVDKVVFADGTIWTRAQLRDRLLTSTAADETFVGFSGSDTYRYARGGGHDTIVEGASSGNADQLWLTDINPAAATLVRNGNDVTLVIAESAPGAGDGGSVLLKNSLDDYYDQGVDKVVFADNTVWTRADIRVKLLDQAATAGNDSITGFNSADTIQGRAGNDTLNGAGGDDSYLYARGDGNDTIFEGTNNGGNDRLVFSDINPSAVSLVRNGNDVSVVIAESAPGTGDGGSVLLKDTLNDYYGQGVDKVVFADGTIWNRADLVARANATVSYASNADAVSVDLALGTTVVNHAALVGQFVRVYQTNGNYLSLAEVQVFDNGQNVALDGTASQKTTGWGGDASRAIDGNTDGVFDHNSVTHTGTPNVGEWWQVDLGQAATIDQIVIFNRADYSNRLGDFDVVITSQALSSSASLQDAISQPGAQVVHYSGTFPSSDTVFATSETHTLTNIKYVIGSAFNDILRGDASANMLLGGGGNDTIEGRGGQDLLSGGAGNDTFIFKAGFGLDTITDFAAGAASDDVIQFGNDVFADFASVLAAATQVGADTVITHDAGNTLTLKNVALANLHQDDFQFIAA